MWPTKRRSPNTRHSTCFSLYHDFNHQNTHPTQDKQQKHHGRRYTREGGLAARTEPPGDSSGVTRVATRFDTSCATSGPRTPRYHHAHNRLIVKHKHHTRREGLHPWFAISKRHCRSAGSSAFHEHHPALHTMMNPPSPPPQIAWMIPLLSGDGWRAVRVRVEWARDQLCDAQNGARQGQFCLHINADTLLRRACHGTPAALGVKHLHSRPFCGSSRCKHTIEAWSRQGTGCGSWYRRVGWSELAAVGATRTCYNYASALASAMSTCVLQCKILFELLLDDGVVMGVVQSM